MTGAAAASAGPFETLSFVVESGVATLTMNRPAAANARSQTMRLELAELYRGLRMDLDVRVLVLRGAGDRFFCAGMDLKEAAGPEAPIERRARLQASRDIEDLAGLPVVTIAAINGYALGGGLEMALACDMRFAAATAVMGLPEVSHGLIPGGGATQRLPRLIGSSRAARMIFTGKSVTATEAEQIGLVDAVLATVEELDNEVREIAATIAAHPVAALRTAKQAMIMGQEVSLSAGVRQELDGLLFLLEQQAESAADPTVGGA